MANRFDVESLVGPEHGVAWGTLLQAQDVAKAMTPMKGWVILNWDDLPGCIRKILKPSTGHKTWVALTAIEPETLPLWLVGIDTKGDPDVYTLKGVTLYVGSM